jgi:beta-glucosidase
MGVMEGGSRAYMAAYNAMNGIPMTVNPILKEITVKEWGAGRHHLHRCRLVGQHGRAAQVLPRPAEAAAGAVKAGINQFLDRISRVRSTMR